jgi:hypothetical protein
MISLILNGNNSKHVSNDVTSEFENAILLDKEIMKARSNKAIRFFKKAYPLFSKLFDKLDINMPHLPGNILLGDYFIVLMGTWNFEQCMPYFMAKGKKYVYLFDAWPVIHKNIIKLVNRWKVTHVFVSSKQVAELLNSYNSKCQFHWIPEGIDLSFYKYESYANKTIDVLQLGRKYDKYHESIVAHLNAEGIIYLYEKVKGEIIFPKRADFINGLANTKISICFPSSLTHPERSMGIETLTNRYLQSMASKCLIVGHAPEELIELFGYNPVVEANMINPGIQIVSILKDFDSYIPLIEKNYLKLLEHTWVKRWEKILHITNETTIN